ncbi:PRD domain-containing protein [Paramaledivibacter caminithermalis]|uniref:Transcriptional antiterminator, BglG family n=1 Tax=Paramaledivibacter caminithermalis (strain DSM 15212 / CIP 107654 / DViRD3) TaxID=1121301 RepID=A0A1M6KII5_PARC5|nr:PRD domain-containing protein [Paramaledivibacter caminithermalis]SHJ58756.1 transcriptional antiterminator, BglG family [Paramaledivibacter caminithermalis DSM 15212]
MTDKNYRVLKILNNNVILAYDFRSNTDTILIGKGIGFGKKENKKIYIPDGDIQRSFVAYNEKMKKEYFRLIEQIDSHIIEISEKIIEIADDRLGDLDSHIHILLTDHIAFAIERVKTGLKIENPFIDEIKIIYPEEFDIATQGIKMIKKKLDVDLGFGEIGFIAMHLHASRKNIKVKETMKNARVLNEIISIIEEGLNITLDKTRFNYKRLINHLQGALDRIKNKRYIDNPLLENIKKEFKESFEIIKKIKIKIEEEYKVNVPEQELGYMAIHIERLKSK